MEEKVKDNLEQEEQVEEKSETDEKPKQEKDTTKELFDKARRIGASEAIKRLTKEHKAEIERLKEEGKLIDPERQRVLSVEEYDKFQKYIEELEKQKDGKTPELEFEKKLEEERRRLSEKKMKEIQAIMKEKEELAKKMEEERLARLEERKRYSAITAIGDFEYSTHNTEAREHVINRLMQFMEFDDDGNLVIVDKDGEVMINKAKGDLYTPDDLLAELYEKELSYCFKKEKVGTGISTVNRRKKFGTEITADDIKQMSKEEFQKQIPHLLRKGFGKTR